MQKLVSHTVFNEGDSVVAPLSMKILMVAFAESATAMSGDLVKGTSGTKRSVVIVAVECPDLFQSESGSLRRNQVKQTHQVKQVPHPSRRR